MNDGVAGQRQFGRCEHKDYNARVVCNENVQYSSNTKPKISYIRLRFSDACGQTQLINVMCGQTTSWRQLTLTAATVDEVPAERG